MKKLKRLRYVSKHVIMLMVALIGVTASFNLVYAQTGDSGGGGGTGFDALKTALTGATSNVSAGVDLVIAAMVIILALLVGLWCFREFSGLMKRG